MSAQGVRIVVGEGLSTRQGLLRFVLDGEGYDVVAEASTAAELARLIATHHPDVAVLDDGIGATAVGMINEMSPDTKVVLVWPGAVMPVGGAARVEPHRVLQDLGTTIERLTGQRSATGSGHGPTLLERAANDPDLLRAMLLGGMVATDEPIIEDRENAPVVILPLTPTIDHDELILDVPDAEPDDERSGAGGRRGRRGRGRRGPGECDAGCGRGSGQHRGDRHLHRRPRHVGRSAERAEPPARQHGAGWGRRGERARPCPRARRRAGADRGPQGTGARPRPARPARARPHPPPRHPTEQPGNEAVALPARAARTTVMAGSRRRPRASRSSATRAPPLPDPPTSASTPVTSAPVAVAAATTAGEATTVAVETAAAAPASDGDGGGDDHNGGGDAGGERPTAARWRRPAAGPTAVAGGGGDGADEGDHDRGGGNDGDGGDHDNGGGNDGDGGDHDNGGGNDDPDNPGHGGGGENGDGNGNGH